MIITDRVETALNTALQKTVTFNVNDKTLREGKIILYNIKDFYITFNIITSKNIAKVYDIPVPFNVVSSKKSIIFDYTLDNIVKNDIFTEYLITTVNNKIGKKSKLYDSKLTIEFMD